MEIVFADVIKVRSKVRSYWISVGPKSDECLYKRQRRTHRHTGKKPREDRGKDKSDAAINQGIPGATRSWKMRGRILPSRVWRERGPANSLISDFSPAEL